MCSILGMYRFDGKSIDKNHFSSLNKLLHHRGPDAQGEYVSGPLALGHNRLSIIDLSESGDQPMFSSDGRIKLVYNGEIYNFEDIRKELAHVNSYEYQSKTDTEVIISAYLEWGIDCVKKFNGIFAFALWDEKEQKLFLTRDRFGVKPLYLYVDENFVSFSSELKTFYHIPEIDISIDYEGIYEYLTFQSLISNRTFLKNIRMLESGTILEITKRSQKKTKYWEISYSQTCDLERPQLLKKVDEKLRSAVQRQLVSDVPISTYLSGGVDSCSIAAMIRSISNKTFNSYTMGFSLEGLDGYEKDFEESKVAQEVAKQLNSNNYTRTIKPEEVPDLIESFVKVSEDGRHGFMFQGFALAKVVGEHNKVVFAGVAGDELFGGYPWRYLYILRKDEEDEVRKQYFDYWARIVPLGSFETAFTQEFKNSVKKDHTYQAFDMLLPAGISTQDFSQRINSALTFEAKMFLPSLLVIEDKFSMHYGIETRVPFLDNELVDFATTIPVKHKFKNYDQLQAEFEAGKYNDELPFILSNEGKYILREVVANYIDPDIAFGIKKGYTLPLGEWFRTFLKNYVETKLLSDNCLLHKIVSKAYIEQTISEHMIGKEHRLRIWAFLFVAIWLEQYVHDTGKKI